MPYGSTQQDQSLEQLGNGFEGQGPSQQGNPVGTEGTTGQPDGQGSGEEIQIQPVEGARDYTNPLLRGKSPEEIERLFQVQQDAIRSQNTELNNYHARLSTVNTNTQAAAPAPSQTEDEGYGDTFLAPVMKRLEDRLSRRLDAMVQPLQIHMVSNAAQNARQKLAGEFRHFAVLEPTIDQIIRQQGGNPSQADEATLRILYHTALGVAAEQGVNLNASAPAPTREEPAPTSTNQPSAEQPRQEQPVNVPQRRPSSAPLPANQSGQRHRSLTEQERRLAREYGMTEEEYIKEMEADIDSVVQPGFSKDNW
jgi:hypothetical protein